MAQPPPAKSKLAKGPTPSSVDEGHDIDIDLLYATEMSPPALHLALRWGVDVAAPLLGGLGVDEGKLSAAIAARQAALAKAAAAPDPSPAGGTGRAAGQPTDLLSSLVPMALAKLRSAAATPEQRYVLAERYGFAFDDLTNWVVRADLLQLPSMTPGRAALLAFVGVLGVHDLAARGATGEPVWGRTEGEGAWPLARAIQLAPDHPDWRRPALRAASAPADEAVPQVDVVREAVAHASRRPAEIVSRTEAIVVVKGAGGQTQDATLSEFVRGFWVAVNAADPQATMAIQPQEGVAGELATIQTGNRRLWVKEAYWEPALKASSALQAFWLEWESATYAYASMVNGLVGVPGPDVTEDEAADAPWTERLARYAKSVVSMFVLYTWLLLFVIFVFYSDRVHGQETVNIPAFINVPALNETQAAVVRWLVGHLPALGAVSAPRLFFWTFCLELFVLAFIRACWAARVIGNLRKQKPRPRMTSEVMLIYVIALAAILVSPVWYLIGLTLLVMSQLALLVARDVFWPCRLDVHTDSLPPVRREPGPVSMGRDMTLFISKFPARFSSYMLSPVLYRFTVVLVLPLVSVLLVITRLLRLIPGGTPIVGGWATSLEKFLASMVSGSMGDVSIYAADPPVASRVQAIVQSDIKWLHERHDVAHIHVFAHSQGTPITYETLFRHLPDRFCRKIRTYVTIGSVLNYYRQANPVLDALYYHRFPIADASLSLREAAFAPGFRWVNFWNRNDPITEFYGLMGFHDDHPTRPTNVLTPGHWFPSTSHGEYWQNNREVHAPLVQRVRGLPDAAVWQTPTPAAWDKQRRRVRGFGKGLAPHRAVIALWAAGVVAFAVIAVRMWPLAEWVRRQLPSAVKFVSQILGDTGVSTLLGGLAPVAQQAGGLVTPKLIYMLLLIAMLLLVAYVRRWLAALLGRWLVVGE